MTNGNSALLRAMVSGMYGGGYGGTGMGMEDGGITGIGFVDTVLNWIMGQPTWLSALIFMLLIVSAAWIAGKIIGKIYISIRYPDPEKPQYLSPIQKLIVLVLCAAIAGTLLSAFMKAEEPEAGMETGLIDPGMNMGGVDKMNPGEGEDTPDDMAIPEGEDVPEGEAAPEGESLPGDKPATSGGGTVAIAPRSGGSGGGVAVAREVFVVG